MAVRKDGTSWWVDFTIRKKRHRYRSPLNTRLGALDFEATARGRLAHGEPAIPPEVVPQVNRTFSDFTREWYDLHVKTENKYSTQVEKERVLRCHLLPFFGSSPLDQITSVGIARFKAEKRSAGLSAKTVNNHLATLQKALNSAVEWGFLERAPKIEMLRTPRPIFDFLTPPESRQLLDAASSEPFWHSMLLCAARTGMRLGELLALDWRAVDLPRRRVHVRAAIAEGRLGTTKSNRQRFIPMSADLAATLGARAQENGFVFPRSPCEPLTSGMAWHALRRVQERSGLRHIGWHVLRHTFASQLMAAGVPMRVIQELLGHSTIAMTERYAHLAPSLYDDVVDVLDRLHAKAGQPAVRAALPATSDPSSREKPEARILAPGTQKAPQRELSSSW